MGHVGEAYFWSMLVVHVGKAYWWSILVEHVGGACWWSMLVKHVGGAYWRSMLVERDGGKKRGVSIERSKAGMVKRSPDGLSLPNQNTITINTIS